MRHRLDTCLLTTAVALCAAATVCAEIPEGTIDIGTLLIRGTAGAADDAVVRLAAAGYEASVDERLEAIGLSRLCVAPAPGSGIDVPSAKDILAAIAGITPPAGFEEAGFNYEYGIGGGQTGSLWVTRAVPHQNLDFRNQYATQEIGIVAGDSYPGGPPGNRLPASGRGVIVAVLDTGVVPVGDLARVALPYSFDAVSGELPSTGAPTLDPGGDGIDSDNDGAIDECVGHGSFVGSLIALVAPEARQLHIRCIESDGRTSTLLIARGVNAAIDAGAHVVNISAVVPNEPNLLGSVVDAARDKGIAIVASAGNSPVNQSTYPASYPSAGSVSVSGPNFGFSAAFATFNREVDFCAPGESRYIGPATAPVPVDGEVVIGIIGRMPLDPTQPLYSTASGSSFSSAFASGLAALVRGAQPEWPSTAVPLASIGASVVSHIAMTTHGMEVPREQQPFVGSGVIDCAAATLFVSTDTVPTLPFDINPAGGTASDGSPRIDGADLAALLSAWGPVLPGRISYADLDHNRVVNGADLAALLSRWTTTP
ncbi:MAG: S8 family serine peptidase [Planctomycetaceae bacterium]|nr:S8 family serine peptidase [Planctomycetaceae bacterium]